MTLKHKTTLIIIFFGVVLIMAIIGMAFVKAQMRPFWPTNGKGDVRGCPDGYRPNSGQIDFEDCP